MARDEPGVLVLCFAAFFTEVATSRHDIVLLVKDQQVLLEVSIVLIVSHKAVARRSGQVPQSVIALAGLDTLVGAVHLGPGFLKDYDPQLIAVRVREARLAITAGNEIVHNDLLLDPILE